MRRWATRTSSCAAHSKASGHISRRMRRTMRRTSTFVGAAAAVAWIVSVSAQSTVPTGAAKAAPFAGRGLSPAETAEQLATVKTYCVTCHNDRVKTGGVSFDGLTVETIGQHAD